jgi:hypothetical protein
MLPVVGKVAGRKEALAVERAAGKVADFPEGFPEDSGAARVAVKVAHRKGAA